MEKAFKQLQRLRYLWILALCGSVGSNDPCDAQNHKPFPSNSFGSRNEVCAPKITPICDYYLTEGWYVAENSTMLNRCPVTGHCGVAYPTWMDGGFPRVEDGEVNHTACIKMEGHCCKMNVTMTIKNCATFYVFYLMPLPACPMVYCFESDLPCDPPTTLSIEGTSTSPGGSSSSGLYHTTSQGQDKQDNDEITHKTSGHSKTILIGVCAGIIGLILGVFTVVFGWMLATGRCKKQRTTVSKIVALETPPPPYSEK